MYKRQILGLAIETVFHLAIYHAYQDRAGLLYGPFSPIYGFGGLFMTVALNRFHDKPIPVIFLISALIGGAFEFTVSWIMQSAFGIVAWDYSGTFLSIDGRTNFMFMCFWGILGVMWVKFLLPILLWMINKIPWKLRYTLTVVCFVFMAVSYTHLDVYKRQISMRSATRCSRTMPSRYCKTASSMPIRIQAISLSMADRSCILT